MKNKGKLPPWLKRRMPASATYGDTRNTLADLKLETICTNANCPNRGQCWDRGTATVLILGKICTRNCKFCSVGHGKPEPPAADEPDRVAEMSKRMGVKYLVITSVDRDDLPDGGAGHFAAVVNRCREVNEDMQFELLTGDFRDSQDESIEILSTALPFVFSHNVETVPSLYSKARPGGNYQRSLDLLRKFKQRFPGMPTKSSMMFGLGETDDEVIAVLKDLRSVGVDRVAMGQYLKPSKESLDVVDYVTPEKFDWWAKKAKELGFGWVMSSPFTRSSYHAELETTD